MDECASSAAPASASSPALALSYSPFSTSFSSCTTDVAQSLVINAQPLISESSALQKLGSNLSSLISAGIDSNFSDVSIYVAGCCVPLHRCILAARCPFFKSLFSKEKTVLASFAPAEKADAEPTKLRLDLSKILTNLTSIRKVNYDTFMAVIGFLYSGQQTMVEVRCIDDQCLHEACRPVVDFAVEMLGLASAFEIIDLRSFWEHHLQNILSLEKAQVDEVIPILVAAKVYGADILFCTCKQQLANSSMDNIDIEKLLPSTLPEEVLLLRSKTGNLQPEMLNPTHEKQRQRIWKALDSHDVELLKLFLKEGQVNLDGAFALHYAVAYCDSHLVKDILELGLADVNSRNNRGFTVLHVAAMRLDPLILGNLLYKGANPLETTPDGRTALQVCSRLIRKSTNDSDAKGASARRESLCLQILYLAGTKNLFEYAAFPPAANEEELLNRLFYLENRVALSRLLFPEETNLVFGITYLESTSEFVGLKDIANKSRKEANMDLNQVPSDQVSGMPNKPQMSEALVKRVEALQRTVSFGRRMFPRFISILDSFTDDDPRELASIKLGSSEEYKTKKRRYSELKSMVAEAIEKDVAAMKNHDPDARK